MNYTAVENPYKDESVIITTRGISDAKVAKLNNDKKRPALVVNWEKLRPAEVSSPLSVSKNYDSLLSEVGIKLVNYGTPVSNTGAKKLRVNKIVNEKAKNIYGGSDKIDIEPQKEEIVVNEEPKETNEMAFTPNVVNSREDVHGRHEKTAEIPVVAIQDAVNNNSTSYPSRAERNSLSDLTTKPEVKQEAKAGDMDLYNNLLHGGVDDDVSRQLQGARNQLSIEKEESRKLAEQYGKAVKELERLKEDIEVTKKQKEQKAKEELSITLKSIENLQKENLERTSDLTSIKSEIARLRAEKQAMEASNFE